MRPEPTSPPRPSTSPACTWRLTPLTAGSRLTPRTSSRTSSRADGPLGIELVDLVADHQLDELLGRRGRRDAGGGGAAVGEHGHAVADAADLVEAVGDVDHADAVGGEPAHDVEQRLDLALVEDRRRLVHDQQAHVDRERPRDRDDLLGRRPQRPDLRARGDGLVAEPREQRGRVRGASGRSRAAARGAARARGRCSPRPSGPRPGRAPGRSSRRRARATPPGRRPGSGSPSKRISPLVGSCTPEMHLISVDLPAPFGPSRQCTSPSRTSKSTPWSALTPGNSFTRSRTSRILRHATTSPRRFRWAIRSPASTFSGLPPQTGSSCSTDRTPSKPPS